MTATWSQIKKWAPEALHDAAEELRSIEDKLIDLGDDLVKVEPTHWTGTAADGAKKELTAIGEVLEDRMTEVAAVRRGLLTAHDAVTGIQSLVADIIDFAASNELSIDAEGTVTDVKEPEGGAGIVVDKTYIPPERDPHNLELAAEERQRLVDKCVTMIEAVLRRAGYLDQELTHVLNNGVLSGELARMDAPDLETAAQDGDNWRKPDVYPPPEGKGTPDLNSAYWNSLSPSEKLKVILGHPEWINNRDGIAADARDAANRVLLPRYLAEWERKLRDAEAEQLRIVTEHADAGLSGYPSQELSDAYSRYQEARDKVDSLKMAEKLIDRDGVSMDGKAVEKDDKQLLALDLSQERAQVAIATGDVDVAENVAVFTPGLSSNAKTIDGYDTDMKNLRERSAALLVKNGDALTQEAALDNVATVVWLGYQSPQTTPDSLFNLTGDSVASAKSASDGGKNLAEFYSGITASRDDDVNLTALGHSYGSTTTGYALQQNDTGVDRVGFFGSPGISVDDLGKLDVPSHSSFYAEADGDAVGDFATFGKDPTKIDGMTHINTDAAKLANGEGLSGISGHTSYLKDGSTNQYNLANLVIGEPNALITGWSGPPLGEVLRGF